jgi:hypothetical protein
MMDDIAAEMRLHGVQHEIRRLTEERNQLIRDLKGRVGVRELARYLDFSSAQVSRIQNKEA